MSSYEEMTVASTALLDPAFAALLCCPVCAERPQLRLRDVTLVCVLCGRIYPIVNGLPDLRPESGALSAQPSERPAADPSA